MKTLLCIDDQASSLAIRKLMLEANGYRVVTATSGREGLALLQSNEIDLVVVDYRMPDMQGDEVAREAKRLAPDLPVLMLSGAVTEFPPEVHATVDGFIVKGQPPSDLLQLIEKLIGEKSRKKPIPVEPEALLDMSAQHLQRSQEVASAARQRVQQTRELQDSEKAPSSPGPPKPTKMRQ